MATIHFTIKTGSTRVLEYSEGLKLCLSMNPLGTFWTPLRRSFRAGIIYTCEHFPVSLKHSQWSIKTDLNLSVVKSHDNRGLVKIGETKARLAGHAGISRLTHRKANKTKTKQMRWCPAAVSLMP